MQNRTFVLFLRFDYYLPKLRARKSLIHSIFIILLKNLYRFHSNKALKEPFPYTVWSYHESSAETCCL